MFEQVERSFGGVAVAAPADDGEDPAHARRV
jgi:hypothetical protein